MTNDQIQAIALANGFKLKQQPDGSMALNPYVFDFARALLASSGQGIPEGWKLVPVELTEEMQVAGIFAASQMRDVSGLEMLNEKRRAIYRAQLAAAPTPPAQEDETVYQWRHPEGYWWDQSKRQHELDMKSDLPVKCPLRVLYTRPDNSGLRKAVEEILIELESRAPESYSGHAMVGDIERKLRAALENK